MKKRHILFIVIPVILIVLLFASSVFAEEVVTAESDLSGSCGDKLSWKYDPENCVLTISGTGDMEAYKSTKKIPWNVYSSEAVKIVVEDGVTSIGKNAFKGFSAVEQISLPNSLTSIGASAFANCRSIPEVTIPTSLASVGSGAFSKCSGLSTVNIRDIISWCKIEFEDEDANPAYYASEVLVNGNSLISLSIPDGVEKIDYILMGFTELVSVKLPSSVKSIGNYAFCDCQNLVTIELHEGLESIGDYAFCGCYSLTSLTIPNTVSSIGEEAFSSCIGLKTVTLSGNLVSIGDSAFAGCRGISEIVLPDSLVSLGAEAFSGCVSYDKYGTLTGGLKKVAFGKNLTTIGSGAFSDCAYIKTVTLPEKLIAVPDQMFLDCSNLESVVLPSGISSIGSKAFANCVKLKEIVIPNSVVSIGSQAFSGCQDLINIYFGSKPVSGSSAQSSAPADTGSSMLAQIGSGAFSGTGAYSTYDMEGASLYQKRINIYISDLKAWCYTSFADAEANPMNDAGTESGHYSLNVYLNGKSLDNLSIPGDVSMISAYAFVDAKCIKSVQFSSSLVGIGLNAFSGCTGIGSVKYTGTAEQWKKVDISAGNEVISGKTVKGGLKTAIKDIRLTGGNGYSGTVPNGKFKLTFTVENLFASRNLMVVALCYDANGRFVSQSSLAIKGGENSTETFKIPVDNRNGKITSYKLVSFEY